MSRLILCVCLVYYTSLHSKTTSLPFFTSIAYGIQHLHDELALMVMLRALLHNKYSNFVLLLMCTKDLSGKDAEVAFQVKQTERNVDTRVSV
jgi:hypothetical protein